MLLCAQLAHGGRAYDLTWTPSLDATNVLGYNAHVTTASATNTYDAGTNLAYSVSNLVAGTAYTFYVSAYGDTELFDESSWEGALAWSVPGITRMSVGILRVGRIQGR
jgi:FtsH-binding integral membrane protein